MRNTQSNVWQHLYAGTTLAVTILVCVFVGIWADKKWDCKPWGTLIGATVGIGVGLYNFLQEFLSDEPPPSKGT